MEQVIRKFLETLRRTQFMPPAQVHDLQRSWLAPLLRHARRRVPFYRDSGRLEPLFRADGSIDWDRWQDIPPLTRTDLQQEFARLRADGTPKSHGRVFALSTSGSTGEPAKVLQTEFALRWVWAALRLRDFEWHQVDPSRRLAFLHPFTADEFDITGVRKSPAWRGEFEALNLRGERVDIADTRPAADLVEAVAAARPAYLQVQPTALQLMVTQDRKRLLADLRLAAVFTYGEHLSRESKGFVESELGCPVFDLYGSSECNYFACSCPKCGNFHVHSETALVETVDAAGNEVAAGGTGRLLVTQLHNFAMPLIRYDHEDFAVKGHPTCSITLPSFDAIIGKRRDPFIFPGDRIIRPSPPTDAMVELLGARIVQIAQTAPDKCEVRILPGSLPPSQMRFDDMTKVLRSIWWDGLQVEYRIVEGFPRPTPRAKFRMIKQEYFNPRDYLGNYDDPTVTDEPAAG